MGATVLPSWLLRAAATPAVGVAGQKVVGSLVSGSVLVADPDNPSALGVRSASIRAVKAERKPANLAINPPSEGAVEGELAVHGDDGREAPSAILLCGGRVTAECSPVV